MKHLKPVNRKAATVDAVTKDVVALQQNGSQPEDSFVLQYRRADRLRTQPLGDSRNRQQLRIHVLDHRHPAARLVLRQMAVAERTAP